MDTPLRMISPRSSMTLRTCASRPTSGFGTSQRNSVASVMQRLKLFPVAVLTAVAVGVLVYQLLPGATNRTPTYDWQCAQCQYRFRSAVRDAAADRPVIDCPKCKALSAERLMHFQCRKCWGKYDLRGTQATLA